MQSIYKLLLLDQTFFCIHPHRADQLYDGVYLSCENLSLYQLVAVQ